MFGYFLPNYMMNNTVLPWSAELGFMGDYTYFNNPNLWLQMQMPMFNPYMTMPGIGDTFMLQNMYNQGFQAAERSFFSNNMGMTNQEIASFKKEINTLLAQKELPSDKRQKLEEIKKLLEETEKKMQALAQKSASQNLETSKAELAQIKEEIKALKQAATLAVKPEEEASETEETEQPEETEQTETPEAETPAPSQADDETQTPAAPAETPASPAETPAAPAEQEVAEPTEAEQKAYTQALDICKNIYVAIDGPGTKEEMLDAAIMSINKDNVIFVMDKWLLDYQARTGDDSLMETIYDDIFSGDTRKKYTEHILTALRAKADELGIDISPEQAVVESQLGRWWRNDGKIYQAIMDIHAKLTNIPLIDLSAEEEAAA